MLKAITTYLKRVAIFIIVVLIVTPVLDYLVPHAVLEFLACAFCYLILAGWVIFFILWLYFSYKSWI